MKLNLFFVLALCAAFAACKTPYKATDRPTPITDSTSVKTDPANTLSKIDSASMPAKTDSIKMTPVTDSTSVPAKVDLTSRPAVTDSTKISPVVDSTSIPAKTDPAKISTATDSPSIPAKVDSAKVSPVIDSASIPAKADSAKVSPVIDSPSIPAKVDSAKVSPVTDSTSIPAKTDPAKISATPDSTKISAPDKTSTTAVTASAETQAAFTKQYPGATNAVWSNHDSLAAVPIDLRMAGWKRMDAEDYLVKFDLNNENYYAWYNSDGNWVGSAYKMNDPSKLPAAVNATVKNAVKTKYPGYSITNVNREFQKDKKAYEVELKKGDSTVRMLVNSDGKIIKLFKYVKEVTK